MAEAVFLVEYNSVSYGVYVLDRMVKRSAVEVVYARPICAGKYLIVLGGEVDDVNESKTEEEALGGAPPWRGFGGSAPIIDALQALY